MPSALRIRTEIFQASLSAQHWLKNCVKLSRKYFYPSIKGGNELPAMTDLRGALMRKNVERSFMVAAAQAFPNAPKALSFQQS